MYWKKKYRIGLPPFFLKRQLNLNHSVRNAGYNCSTTTPCCSHIISCYYRQPNRLEGLALQHQQGTLEQFRFINCKTQLATLSALHLATTLKFPRQEKLLHAMKFLVRSCYFLDVQLLLIILFRSWIHQEESLRTEDSTLWGLWHSPRCGLTCQPALCLGLFQKLFNHSFGRKEGCLKFLDPLQPSR